MRDSGIPFRLVIDRNDKSKHVRWAGRQGTIPPFGLVSRSVIERLFSFSVSSHSPTIRIMSTPEMSTPDLAPDETLDDFFSTFHPEFPYDPSQWRDNLVLESLEGTRFHFPAQILIDASAFFAGAPVSTASVDEKPLPGLGRLQPIPISFASIEGMSYFLSVLRPTTYIPSDDIEMLFCYTGQGQEWGPTIAALRVAHILDVPNVIMVILARSDFDVYQRYAVYKVFANDLPKSAITATTERARHISDISFFLDQDTQYARCVDLLKEFTPRGMDKALVELFNFYRQRKGALSTALLAWTHPDPWTLNWACSRTSRRAHARNCAKRSLSPSDMWDRMQVVAPIIMLALSTAKTKSEAWPRIQAALFGHVGGCRGCMGGLEDICMPAVQKFQEVFPIGPITIWTGRM